MGASLALRRSRSPSEQPEVTVMFISLTGWLIKVHACYKRQLLLYSRLPSEIIELSTRGAFLDWQERFYCSGNETSHRQMFWMSGRAHHLSSYIWLTSQVVGGQELLHEVSMSWISFFGFFADAFAVWNFLLRVLEVPEITLLFLWVSYKMIWMLKIWHAYPSRELRCWERGIKNQ